MSDTERIEINEGEFFEMDKDLLLVHEYESVLGDLFKMDGSEHQLAYLFTFKGRINKTDEHRTVTVGLDPQAAFDLTNDILHGLELLAEARKNEAQLDGN